MPRMRSLEEVPDKELRRLANRLVSMLSYGDNYDNAMLPGRPPMHFRVEMWWCRGWCPCQLLRPVVEAQRSVDVSLLAEWMGPGDLVVDGTRLWLRSARPDAAWLLQAADEYAANREAYLEVRRRFVDAGGFWAAPPEGLRPE